MNNLILLYLICALPFIYKVNAWDNDDFEVFDVVEEVNNQNFYELLGVAQDAAPSEIKSAFKKLTLKLHPDKNDAPDADVQFRNLVSVHNILKDPGKREKYNQVLKNGLPNWRSAVYYYRHVRKMGLFEGAIILFIIITFGQYAVGWAAYAEKRYTAEQILTSRVKRSQRKSGFDTGIAEVLEQLPKPSIKNTLPFQIPKFIWTTVVSIPTIIMAVHQHYKEMKLEKIRQAQREEEASREAEEPRNVVEKGPRRRRGFVPLERECVLDSADEPHPKKNDSTASVQSKQPVVSGGLWTDDDLAELIRLVKKYPGGTSERWERIAEFMCRSVPEVTHMAAKLKDNCYKVPDPEPIDITPVEQPKKVKTRKTEAVDSQANWTQTQQKALEVALAKHPKGGAGDRWEKIAKSVPDKTKEECMLRCKYLADLLRKQKQKEEETQQQDPSDGSNNTELEMNGYSSENNT